ncbi:hypothetical protein COZ14_04860 [Candidatus Dojkabacteria bacterium CG_4_10_14_3_um_filter_Dojkabacteria_WS6_41_9]|nr:MAG: hypothetical protein COZ14_04860 [Candidatus Dojkabacteria bacterium CG_4_10_14_3_um_filter_Dojkabacteria_WS6_41_9]
MQSSAKSKINFSKTDRYVEEFQNAGFKTLVLALRSRSLWASKDFLLDHSPKSEYLDDYGNWIQVVVERYDKDGMNDMPGLKYPVIYYEIGTEFSSYEPESTQNYLEMLATAYKVAHTAYSDVKILHAAFLTSNVFKSYSTELAYSNLNEIEKHFKENEALLKKHAKPLAENRKVLDRSDIFDVVNFHSLGNPEEIEGNVRWLELEMKKRGISKPIIISDTGISPFVGLGPATSCKGKQVAILFPPANNNDRCRLAEYFKKLINKDSDSLEWVRGFAGIDVVKRVVIAADQGVTLIDTVWAEELPLAQAALFQAASGNNGWGGMTKTNINVFTEQRTIVEIYPSFYALKQLQAFIKGYTQISRIQTRDTNVRIYELIINKKKKWIAWYESGKLLLPEDKSSTVQFQFTVDSDKTVENVITKQNQTNARKQKIKVAGGKVSITLTDNPLYIY